MMLAAEGGFIDVVVLTNTHSFNSFYFVHSSKARNVPVGRTAMMLAAEGGFIDVVDALLAAGGHAHARDRDGATAFFLACRNNHMPVCHRLAELGADVNVRLISGDTMG
jgi:ankyrin repeat protein